MEDDWIEPRYNSKIWDVIKLPPAAPKSHATISIRTEQAMRLAIDLFREIGEGVADRIDSSPGKMELSLNGLSVEKYKEYYELFTDEVGEENISGSFRD